MKRLATFLAVVTVALLGPARPASAEDGVEIKMPSVLRCVGVLSSTEGAPVVLLTACPQTTNMFWELVTVTPNNFEWQNESSGKCLTATAAPVGSPIVQSTCVGGPNQIWRQVNISGSVNSYVVNQWSFGCLGHSGLAPNVPMVVNSCTGAFQQYIVL